MDAPFTLSSAVTDALHAGQSRVLEMIIARAPLAEILTELARLMESLCAGMSCSVLLVDADGKRLRSAGGSSLPEAYNRWVDGLEIGEGFGSCGTAAARKVPVIVTDVRSDPLWARYQVEVERFRLAACWSTPILAHGGRLLGTFAMYFHAPRTPSEEERHLIHAASRLAGIAIERKQTEEALRKADEKFRHIFEQAVDGIFQLTPEGRFLEANPAFARMLGFESGAALIAGVRDIAAELCAEPERFLELARALQAGGIVQRWEIAMRHRDGQTVWLSIDARQSVAADGQTLVYEGIARDITERKRLEQQFLQAQKMEAFGQLAGGVAHDFNNLLTVILGNLSLVRLGDLPAGQKDAALDECYGAAERAAALTGQLLTFSRRNQIAPGEFDLNEIVANVAQMLRRVIGEHIDLQAGLAPRPLPVRVDAGLMEQAVMNLALNARDAMPKGGRLRLGLAEVDLDAAGARRSPRARPGSFARLSVTDTGTGIAPENLPHIFEPFFTTKEAGKGTGLGLAMVFGIVERHEGWIDVDSEVGVGTTMHVYLPRLTHGVAAPRPMVARDVPPGGTERILVVEDEVEVRAMMRKALERHGYQVRVAANGPEALTQWVQAGGEIDLVVTDLVMPGGLNGRELAEALWTRRPGLRVLFCSGYTADILSADPPLRLEDNFLEKPFDVHLFLRRVRMCLDGAGGRS